MGSPILIVSICMGNPSEYKGLRATVYDYIRWWVQFLVSVAILAEMLESLHLKWLIFELVLNTDAS